MNKKNYCSKINKYALLPAILMPFAYLITYKDWSTVAIMAALLSTVGFAIAALFFCAAIKTKKAEKLWSWWQYLIGIIGLIYASYALYLNKTLVIFAIIAAKEASLYDYKMLTAFLMILVLGFNISVIISCFLAFWYRPKKN